MQLSFLFFLLFSFSLSAQESLLQGPKRGGLNPIQAQLPFQVTVWNTFKGGRWGYDLDFQRLNENSDLMLLQEVLLNKEQKELFERSSRKSWVMAQAWKSQSFATGVAILSNFSFDQPKAILSEDTEPIADTPKSSVLMYLPVQGESELLLVVNTHAINFTFIGPFKRQLKAIAQVIQKHQGPVLWAGDFNTWSGSRWDLLYDQVARLGLEPISFGQDPRSFILDHVFVRGIDPLNSQVLSEFQTSDHWPLFLRLQVNPYRLLFISNWRDGIQ